MPEIHQIGQHALLGDGSGIDGEANVKEALTNLSKFSPTGDESFLKPTAFYLQMKNQIGEFKWILGIPHSDPNDTRFRISRLVMLTENRRISKDDMQSFLIGNGSMFNMVSETNFMNDTTLDRKLFNFITGLSDNRKHIIEISREDFENGDENLLGIHSLFLLPLVGKTFCLTKNLCDLDTITERSELPEIVAYIQNDYNDEKYRNWMVKGYSHVRIYNLNELSGDHDSAVRNFLETHNGRDRQEDLADKLVSLVQVMIKTIKELQKLQKEKWRSSNV